MLQDATIAFFLERAPRGGFLARARTGTVAIGADLRELRRNIQVAVRTRFGPGCRFSMLFAESDDPDKEAARLATLPPWCGGWSEDPAGRAT